MKRRMSFLAALLALTAARPTAAQSPSPIDPLLHSFPGSVTGTTSAASAGLGLADRWLGEEPFANPAIASSRAVSVSPLLQRVSRQDLRADNREFDDAVHFDVSSGWAAFAVRGVALSVYAWQPVLRHEDVAFIRGEEGTPPAVVACASTQREIRAGLGVSFPVLRSVRVGVAGEWTRRDDSYDLAEESGDPGAGTRELTLSGDGVGIAIGARALLMPFGDRAVTLGAAFRTVPALDLDGDQALRLAGGDSDSALSTRRGGSMEGGLSASIAVTPAVRVFAQAGFRGREDYAAGGDAPFTGVEAGPASGWSLGFEYAEPEVPLQLRAGAGQETQTRVPEPRAGVYALGLGWRIDESLTLDVAGLRRTFAHAGRATSYDDRVVVTVGLRY